MEHIIRNCWQTTVLIVYFIGLLSGLNADPFPITFYDYQQVINNYSPQVAAVGGLNITEPTNTHTAFYNPALLAFREKTVITATLRYFSEAKTAYGVDQQPVHDSSKWYRNDFSYLGIDSHNIGFSYVALADLKLERDYETEGESERLYLDYYLDAYRFSFAERSGLLAFGFNLSFLTGRTVYLRELSQDDVYISEQFVDSRSWGYNVDFGAAVKSGGLSYGLTIPNLLSRVYWKDHPSYSLQRRLQAGIQWGEDENYLLAGISRKFDFSSDNLYHFGLERAISFGLLRGDYQYMPLRLGLFTEQFNNLKDIGYAFGTGFQYSMLQIDLSYMMIDQEKKNYAVLLSLSAGI
ncbi:MAG: hypothetical protein K0B81_08990 [Candidatus Cloacimonetes bacterium]|nr:hypothetical protein [Candidatus Cloacimonadota bacterium]